MVSGCPSTLCAVLTSPTQFVPQTFWSLVYRGSSLNAQLLPAESPCLLSTLDWLTIKCNARPSTWSYSSTATLFRPSGGLLLKKEEGKHHYEVHKVYKVQPACICLKTTTLILSAFFPWTQWRESKYRSVSLYFCSAWIGPHLWGRPPEIFSIHE